MSRAISTILEDKENFAPKATHYNLNHSAFYYQDVWCEEDGSYIFYMLDLVSMDWIATTIKSIDVIQGNEWLILS